MTFMNKKEQAQKLNEAIQRLQSAKGLIQTKHFKHARDQIHEAVSSCDCIVNNNTKKKRKGQS